MLSHSLPVRIEEFDDLESRPFFSGLLPEGEFLRAVARSFGVSASNPFSLLDAIGGECAGAVSMTPDGSGPIEEKPPKWLTSEELADLIEELPTKPLSFDDDEDDEDGLRLSLAGAMEKLPVVFQSGSIGITRGDPPSTHIIKLPPDNLDDLVANEAFCLSLASKCGLKAAEARPVIASRGMLSEAGEPEFLLVTRYDRVKRGTKRLHQEDLCQSLGIVPDLKYEADGGPGVRDCAEQLRRFSATPAIDILAFGDALVFNMIIGNHDAHSKNYSMLLEGRGAPKLAPLYDLVATTVYPGLSRKMAMKMGGEYRPDYVRKRHLVRLADDLGVATNAFLKRVEKLCERIRRESTSSDLIDSSFTDRPVLGRIRETIENRSTRLLSSLAES